MDPSASSPPGQKRSTVGRMPFNVKGENLRLMRLGVGSDAGRSEEPGCPHIIETRV